MSLLANKACFYIKYALSLSRTEGFKIFFLKLILRLAIILWPGGVIHTNMKLSILTRADLVIFIPHWIHGACCCTHLFGVNEVLLATHAASPPSPPHHLRSSKETNKTDKKKKEIRGWMMQRFTTAVTSSGLCCIRLFLNLKMMQDTASMFFLVGETPGPGAH